MSAPIVETAQGVVLNVVGYNLSSQLELIAARQEQDAVQFSILDYRTSESVEVEVYPTEAEHVRMLLNANHTGNITLDRGEAVDGEGFVILNLLDGDCELGEATLAAFFCEPEQEEDDW